MSFIRFLIAFVRHFVVPVAILAALGLVTRYLVLSEPEVPRAVFEGAPPVCDFVEVSTIDEPSAVEAQGSVLPHRAWTLETEVGGVVTAQHEGLVVGGRVKAGETLLEIDRREYELAADQARAQLEKARFDLDVEKGMGVVARREWTLLEKSIETTDEGRALALREPHRRQREAAVAGAEASVSRCELDVERTSVRAPFNAVVVEESVETGQVVAPRTPLARLVCTDEFHVRVSLPIARLADVTLPAGGRAGSTVDIVQRLDDGTDSRWSGEVVRLLADVGDEGRQARLLVRVDEPLDVGREPGRRIPLLIGSYVTVRITGRDLEDVVAIPRDHLREGGTVWLLSRDDRLIIRTVEVVGRNGSKLLVRGLASGDRLVTSSLVDAVEDSKLAPRAVGERGRR